MMIQVIAKVPGFIMTHFRQNSLIQFQNAQQWTARVKKFILEQLALTIMDMSYGHKFSKSYPSLSNQTSESPSKRNRLFER